MVPGRWVTDPGGMHTHGFKNRRSLTGRGHEAILFKNTPSRFKNRPRRGPIFCAGLKTVGKYAYDSEQTIKYTVDSDADSDALFGSDTA